MVETLIMIALSVVACLMIVLILIQRGKGGGLAGAFGGMGGQSAFGTKAGDMFTRITMWSAFFWIVMCALTVRYMGSGNESTKFGGGQETNVPADQQQPAGQRPIVPGDPDPSSPDSSDATDSGNTTDN